MTTKYLLRPLLAALVLMGSGCLPPQQQGGAGQEQGGAGQQQGEPQLELTGQQVASLRAAIQELGGRAIIGFKPEGAEGGMKPDGTPALSPDQVRDLAASLAPMGVVVLRQFQRIPAVSVRMDPSGLQELLANPNIEYVEPDRLNVPSGFRRS